jgi:ribonuclease-3
MTIEEFENKNNLAFINKGLLEQAFIHRSFINENPRSGLSHNERLEFLGDAVLELVVTEFLYARFPNHAEGDLTAYRSALVNAVTLGEVAERLGFNNMMKLSKGEAKDVSRARASILADAYEAVVGALYLDQGYEKAKVFVSETVLAKTDEVISKGLYKDAKSFVQEKSQELLNVTPSYKVVSEEGPDHDKRFTVSIFFGTDEVAQGEGKSKQEAETQAAKAALLKKGWIHE